MHTRKAREGQARLEVQPCLPYCVQLVTGLSKLQEAEICAEIRRSPCARDSRLTDRCKLLTFLQRGNQSQRLLTLCTCSLQALPCLSDRNERISRVCLLRLRRVQKVNYAHTLALPANLLDTGGVGSGAKHVSGFPGTGPRDHCTLQRIPVKFCMIVTHAGACYGQTHAHC